MSKTPSSSGEESPDESTYVHENMLFLLTGDHPHAGEQGHPIGESPETITAHTMFGAKMYELHLVDCKHGTERCYAEKKNMKLLQAGDVKL